jgi:hypothetical protein
MRHTITHPARDGLKGLKLGFVPPYLYSERFKRFLDRHNRFDV